MLENVLIAHDLDIDDIRDKDMIMEVANADNDHKVANNELGSFEFLLAVNFVSKQLQSQDMLIDIPLVRLKY